jgi:ABC-type multidrug transport system fused ATPase/permease subunit
MTPFQTRYYNFWTRFVNSNKFVNIYSLDFQKPFWQYLFHDRFQVAMLLVHRILTSMFNPIFLIFITKAILERDLSLFLVCSAAKIFQQLIITFFNRGFVYMYDNAQASFKTSVQKTLIQIDPIFHTTKSSGEIVAKVERTSNSIHTFISTIFEIIIPLLIAIGVSLWLIFLQSWIIGIIVTVLFVILCSGNIAMATFGNRVFLNKMNQLEEQEKQFLLENITQNHYIRSVFATPEQLQNTLATIKSHAMVSITKWRSWQYLVMIVETLLIIVILGIIGYQLFFAKVDTFLVVGLLNALYDFYNKFWELGINADEFFKSIHNQNEFWEFMRNFGESSFPVLESFESDLEQKIKAK